MFRAAILYVSVKTKEKLPSLFKTVYRMDYYFDGFGFDFQGYDNNIVFRRLVIYTGTPIGAACKNIYYYTFLQVIVTK